MAGGSVHHVDNVMLALGPKGKYQILHMLVVSLNMFPCAWQLLSNVFTCRSVPHHCGGPDNITNLYNTGNYASDQNVSVNYEKCNIEFSSNGTIQKEEGCLYGVEYELPVDASAVSQFDLVCDSAPLAKLSQTVVILGQGVGAVIMTTVSDRIGRKKVICGCNLGMLVVGLIIAYAPNYYVFVVGKFFAGACQQGTGTSGSTFLLEMFIAEDRRITAVVSGTLWALGTMTLALVSFLFQGYSWRTLQMVYSLASVFAVFQWWFLDESFRWLVANGKSEEAIKVIKRAARMNNKDPEVVLQVYEYTEPLKEMTESELTEMVEKDLHVGSVATTITKDATKKLNFLDIFRVRRLLINALVMWFAWFTTALSFFVIYLTSTSLSGNRFLNFFLTALMEVPSNIFFYFSLNRLGRKITTIIPFAIVGLGLFSAGIFKYLEPRNAFYSHLTAVASMFAMVGSSGSFGIVYLYTPEMFPTNLRNQALGVSSFFARIGGMLAPFIGVLAEQATWAPGLMIGCFAGAVCLFLKVLPETTSRELPQTVEDLQNWFTKKGKKSDLNNKETNGIDKDLL